MFLQFTYKTLIAQTDADYDGMDDAWEITNRLDPNDPTDAWCDNDCDQILNLFEYQLQTDPNVFASPPIRYFTPQNTQDEFVGLMNSGIDDLAVIRMSAGNYNLFYNTLSSGGLITSADYKIMIQGGWNEDFTVYDPFQYSTIFDGENSENILVLETNEDRQTTFILEGVEITNSGRGFREAAVKCIGEAGTNTLSFYNCSFYNNGLALGIFWPQAVTNSSFFLINSSIVNNTNGLYGQLSLASSGRWRIYNSTITNTTQNALIEIEGNGQTPGAITIDVLNSIIWDVSMASPILFPTAQNIQMNVAYSNVGEINNIDNSLQLNLLNETLTNIDPEFTSTTTNHFQLQDQSPLKEIGYNTGLPFNGLLPDIGVNQKVLSKIKIDTLITQPTCLGDDGFLEIVSLDDAKSLNFSLNDIDYQTENTFSNLPIGNYTLFVKAEGACQKIQLPFILKEVEQELRKESATFCDNDRYLLPDGNIVAEPGIYNSIVSNSLNCSVNIETTLTALTTYEITEEVSICAGEIYTLIDGQEVSQSGRYNKKLETVEGCDSTFITILTVNISPITQNTISFCENAEATYTLEDGTVVSNEGTYTVELLNNFTNCIDTYITTINYTDVLETTQNVSICEGQTYVLPDGREVSALDTYQSNFQSVQGCDSVIFTNLTFDNSVTIVNEDINICEEESHTLPDGRIVTEQNTYITEFIMDGCPQRVITKLTVNFTDLINTWIFICKGESFELPDGRIVMEEGTYPSYFNTIFGCDSTVNIILDVRTPLVEDEINICIGETYTLENETIVSETGNYNFELISETGCITTYNTIVKVNEVYEVSQNIIICNDNTYTLPDGVVANETGVYESLLLSAEGCDSIVTTNLNINSTQIIEEEKSICEGDTYTLEDGRIVSEAGTYAFELVDVTTGCSAPYSITISINEAIETTQEVSICAGDTYLLPDGLQVAEENTYQSILQTVQGCDSIITTNLAFAPIPFIEETINICTGTSYTLADGTVVSQADTYLFDAVDQQTGCISSYSTTIIIDDELMTFVDAFVCKGQTYILPDGLEVLQENVFESYESIIQPAEGCNSIITTNLTVVSILTVEEAINICKGQTYILPNGMEVAEPNTYESKLQSVQGCDSIINTILTVSPPLVIQKEINICSGATYTLEDGLEVADAGIYFAELQDETTGCITTHQTNISLINKVETTENATVCEGETYTLPDGKETIMAGTYESILQTVNGCDSIVKINLTTTSINISLPVELSFITGGVELVNSIQSQNEVEYLWSPAEGLSCTDCAQPIANPTETTTYVLQVTDAMGGCTAEATVEVIPIKGEPIVPNAFSPNDDGINDYLIPFNIEGDTDFLFVIYNRYGKKVFETQNVTQPWLGFYNNEKQAIGVYVWFLQYQLPEGATKQLKGNVTLVR